MRFWGRPAQIGIASIILISAVIIGLTSFNPFGPSVTHAGQTSETPLETEPVSSPAEENIVKEPAYVLEQADIVVIGSEMEGLYLARAAADEGLTVKILDPREAFGGQLLQGQMLFLDETKDESGKSLLQGRVKELFTGFKNAKIRKLGEFERYINDLIKPVSVESGIRIDDVITEQSLNKEEKIASIIYTTKDQTLKKISASYWVDNSDYAALISKLKAVRMPGLETVYGLKKPEFMASGMMMKFKNVDWKKFQSAFNSLSAEERNKKYGGGSVNESYAVGLTGVMRSYKATNDRVFLRGLNALYQRDGEVIINALLVYNVNPSDDQSIEEAVQLGRKEMPLILQHFRSKLPGWEKAKLADDLPAYPYIREYNHYETDYVLKPSDLLSGRMFWDNVSIAGYPMDLQGVQAVKWGIEMGRPDKYGMPLRSFLLKNYSNVIMAGKNVGASVVAYGSARIQPNTALAAESIGIILGQIQGKQQLKQLTEADMKKLQQYIEQKYKIRLTGITGKNKLAGWTADEISKLDAGEIYYPEYSVSRKAKPKK